MKKIESNIIKLPISDYSTSSSSSSSSILTELSNEQTNKNNEASLNGNINYKILKSTSPVSASSLSSLSSIATNLTEPFNAFKVDSPALISKDKSKTGLFLVNN